MATLAEQVSKEQADFERSRSAEDLADEALAQQGDAAEGDAADEDDGTPQLVIPGTGTRLSTSVGGKKPTESLFKMSAVSLPIAGQVQIEKDTEMWVAVPVAIDDVRHRNRRKGRDIVSVARVHTAIPIGQPIILDGPPPGIDEDEA